MSSYTIQGASESIYSYTRRRWDELRVPSGDGSYRSVSNDDAGANAAARLIFVEIKKNPSLVTEALPPDFTYIKRIIDNPSNPLTWVWQKTGQAASAATHSVAVNLDKPAQLLTDIGNALPWYTKPGAIVGIFIASMILPRIFESSIKGFMKGRGSRKNG